MGKFINKISILPFLVVSYAGCAGHAGRDITSSQMQGDTGGTLPLRGRIDKVNEFSEESSRIETARI